MTSPSSIPEAAVEAAVEAHCEGTMIAALEAAYPHMLSHEREETRLAHVDAVVNAEAADQLETKLAAIIVALDPLERVANWAAADDNMDCPAFRAVRKIRTILDAAR